MSQRSKLGTQSDSCTDPTGLLVVPTLRKAGVEEILAKLLSFSQESMCSLLLQEGDGVKWPLMLVVTKNLPDSPWRWVVWPLSEHIPERALLFSQEHFPSREEKFYPGWVQVTCVLLSFLPSLWVPGVALAQLLSQYKQRWKATRLKLQESRGC